MQVKKQVLSDTQIKLTVIADQAFIDSVKTVVLRRMGSKDVKLPGFRAGKAPLNLVEKNVDTNVLQKEFLEEAINRMYATAVKSEDLRPIDQPKIELKKFVPYTTIEFEAEFVIIGEVELPDYKKVKKNIPKVIVNAREIDGV